MKRAFLFFLMCLLPLQSFAAAVPAYSPNFGNAMAGVIQQKAIQRGFAANDPRYTATTTAVGAALTATATGLAAAAGAPLWGTIAVGAIAAGAVALGIGALTEWLFDGNGIVTAAGGSSAPVPGAATAGQSIFQLGSYGSTDSVAAWKAIISAQWNAPSISAIHFEPMTPCNWQGVYDGPVCLYVWATGSYFAGQSVYINGVYQADSQIIYTGQAGINAAGVAPSDCASGFFTNGTCGAPWLAPSVVSNNPAPVPKSISDSVADVPAAEMALPVNPELLAKAVNDQWAAAAAQPGYAGLPFSPSDPVTVADVQTYQAANPAAYPTVGDFLSPAVAPSGQTGAGTVVAPSATPAPGTTTSPGINPAPAGSPQVNLGVDPVIGLPNLESTPTASGILAPILGLFPSLKSFVVPSHSSVCPSPSMDLFGKTLVLDGHCTLLEAVRPTLYAVMAFVWVVIGLFIILAA